MKVKTSIKIAPKDKNDLQIVRRKGVLRIVRR
jgi:ribosomal protein L36